MADREIRDAARAVERSVSPPDFGDIAARGQHLRRRRRWQQAALSGAAVVLVGVAVALPWSRLDGDSEPQPAEPPGETDSQRAALLLSDPDAVADEDAFLVSDQGAVLQRVSISSPVGGECDADERTALMWHGWDGGRRAWTSDVSGREVVAVPDGFAVGALSGACAEVLGEQEAQRGAYVVDASGETRDVVWQAGAERRCGVVPDSPGCVVDVASGTGEVVPGARETPGPGFLRLGTSGPAAWAASTDGTRLAWTQDGGRTWSEHRTTLTAAPGDTVQSSAAGDVAVFFAWPRVEVSRDHGATWQERDLESALAPVLVANPVLHVTADGLLAGVSYPTTGRPFVFVSTDTSWTRFERSDFRTARGDFDLGVSGPWLWTHDQGSTWLSRDALDWRHVVPLVSPGSR